MTIETIIDIHNHSIPGIDDGAKDIEMSLEMLNIAKKNGTTDIILTPHHLNGAFNNFADDVIKSTASLKAKAKELNISINLHHGCEVHLVPETVEQLINNKALTFCGLGKAALIELPKSTIPSGTESILSELIYHEITPVIAHPERNSSLRKDHSPLFDWIEFGCWSQLTGQSCTGTFGESIQKFSFELIANNLTHFIASDAHRPKGRNPNLRQAFTMISETFDKSTATLLFHDNPSKLLKGLNAESLNLNTEEFSKLFSNKSSNRKNQKKKGKGWFKFFN